MPHLPCMRPVTAAMINTFHGNSGGRVAQLVDSAHRGRNSVLARGESSEVETGSATEGHNPMCRRSSFVEGNFMKVSSASSHCLKLSAEALVIWKGAALEDILRSGSSGRIRTYNPPVNSRILYR